MLSNNNHFTVIDCILYTNMEEDVIPLHLSDSWIIFRLPEVSFVHMWGIWQYVYMRHGWSKGLLQSFLQTYIHSQLLEVWLSYMYVCKHNYAFSSEHMNTILACTCMLCMRVWVKVGCQYTQRCWFMNIIN